MKIKDKTIVITGAGRGIGRALAIRFATQGAHIALLDMNAADLAAATQQCVDLGVRAKAYTVDVSREAEVAAALDAVVRDFGSLDVIINNAGIVKDALLIKVKDGDVVGKMSLEQWRAVIDVNLTGVFLCAREAAERMIKLAKGGVIINISSISRHGNAGQSNYAAAKSGVASMSTVLPPNSTKIEGRVRRSCGSEEWHTAQSQPTVGTPMDVPLPRTVSVAFIT